MGGRRGRAKKEDKGKEKEEEYYEEEEENLKKEEKETVVLVTTGTKRLSSSTNNNKHTKKGKTKAEGEEDNNEARPPRFRRRMTWEGAASFARTKPSAPRTPDDASLPFRTSILLPLEEEQQQQQEKQKQKQKKNCRVQNKGKQQQQQKNKRAIGTLQQLCVEVLCQNIESVESFGEGGLPPDVQSLLCQRLVRHRRLTRDTLLLFLQEPRLPILKLPGCSDLTQQEFQLIPAHCPDLKRLALGGCGRLSDEVVKEVMDKCESLEELSLEGCYGLTDSALLSILQHPRLQHFSLSWAPLCFQHEFHRASSSSSLLRQLTSLSLTHCAFFDAKAAVKVTGRLGNLTELCISECPAFNDEALQLLLAPALKATIQDPNHNHPLRKLVVRSCEKITERGVLSALGVQDEEQEGEEAVHYLNMRHLELRDLPKLGSGIRRCAGHLPSLQSLVLSECPRVGEDVVLAFLSSCSQLSQLHLKSLPQLCFRDLSSNQTTTTQLVKAFRTASNRKKTLKDLDLSWSREISDESLLLILGLSAEDEEEEKKRQEEQEHKRQRSSSSSSSTHASSTPTLRTGLQKLALWGTSQITDVCVGKLLKAGIQVTGKDRFAL